MSVLGLLAGTQWSKDTASQSCLSHRVDSSRLVKAGKLALKTLSSLCLVVFSCCPAGIAENSHLRKSNYFYYNCITGHFLRDNCPSYLREENYNRLHNGVINNLTISTGFFLEELRARKYTKVRTLCKCCSKVFLAAQQQGLFC